MYSATSITQAPVDEEEDVKNFLSPLMNTVDEKEEDVEAFSISVNTMT